MSNNCCQCKQTGNNQIGCQTKVNEGLMTMKEYHDTCQEMGPDVEITEEEFNRLCNVWTERGFKFIVNEKTGQITFV